MERIEKSYCRLCFGFCGMNVTIDEQERVVSVRGDHDNPLTRGYACVKGLDVPDALYGDRRIMHPLKKVGDGFVRIGLEQALDEIGERMREIVADDGLDALAFFRGTGSFGSNVAVFAWPALADSIGGQRFSTLTIDQSAKMVKNDRLGTFAAPRQPFEDADVWLFAGSNPLVSVFSWNTPAQNPMKALKEARARGTKIIVIDPRACEIAKFADIHLQIYPGEDAAVAAGLLNVILANGWEDTEFCARHVEGMEALRAAVAPFDPEMVARRAGIDPADLIAAADLFARQSKRGSVGTGTGVDMARFPNLAEHLYEVIGIICGRFLREGEVVPNPGVLAARSNVREEAISPTRSYEQMPRSRVRGAITVRGEKATPTLAEEILTPGPGRIRALLICGANPVHAIPDIDRVIDAFAALDLLVVVEPFETATTRMADYVLPPRFLYEHADFTYGLEMSNLSVPYGQYTPALVPQPAGAELADEGYVAWAIAKRMKATLRYLGVDMDMETPPSDEDFLRIIARNSAIPFDTFKIEAVGGKMFELPPLIVDCASEKAGRFAVMPDDVAAELIAFQAVPGTAVELATDETFDFRLIVRRMREVSNTSCRHFKTAQVRAPYNPLSAHPEDLAALGLENGDEVRVVSDNGAIPAIVKSDRTLKRCVVSMTHGFGELPGDQPDYRRFGASVSKLISLDRDMEALQAMPRMTGVPVRIEPISTSMDGVRDMDDALSVS